ncbi:D-tagatose 3-epimerase [Ensifer adhaerens]|uniref:sugar phosphate isomerase/epimerase family protein n=1 Tax=Ensifer adhaerens TaxID=106592 RepID=UPI00156A4EAE|nr:sugar phosphate isomerase/epimerase family protein [Ensifer adhaerens]NRP18312.1 D-tagatose 3-epimerase [Ensifer adhaerens]
MLNRKQLIGANFSFQHHPFRWTAEHLCAMGFDRMELWGIAPHLDLFHDSRAQLAEVKAILSDNGLTVRCFTPEQVLYPVNIASGHRSNREASVGRFLHAADICAELGATYLFLTPGRGFECESRDIALAHSVASINRIAAHARNLGVSCLLEPLQRVESNIVTNANELYALWRALDDEHIDVVLDLVVMATAGHLAWGDGDLPLGDYLAELGAHGFTGTLTFEPFGNGSSALDPVSNWRRCLDAVAPDFNQAEQA